MCTDPALHGPLTDPGCSYASCFTSKVAPEVKVEQSPTLKVEWSRVQTPKAEWNRVLTQRQGGVLTGGSER